MGAWGTEIFSDDLAADIRGEYNALLSIGKSNAEAEELMIAYYSEIVNNGDEDEPVFWFALALSEWNKGRLSEKTKVRALEFIKKGGDLERWNTLGNEKNYKRRVTVIQNFQNTLLSTQPLEKKIRKATVHHCPWRVGDLLAYRIVTRKDIINGPFSNMWEKYALLRVIQINKHPISQIAPTDIYDESMLVGLYGWTGDSIPEPNIVKNLEYIPIVDYIPEPPVGMADLSSIKTLPDESQEKILTALKQVFSTQRRIQTCASLNWIPIKGWRCDITLLSNGFVDKPEYFKTSITEYSLHNLASMDYQLAERLQPYIGKIR